MFFCFSPEKKTERTIRFVLDFKQRLLPEQPEEFTGLEDFDSASDSGSGLRLVRLATLA